MDLLDAGEGSPPAIVGTEVHDDDHLESDVVDAAVQRLTDVALLS